MAEKLGESFELTDGTTARRAHFKMPDGKAGLRIMAQSQLLANPEILEKAIIAMTDIAAAHLVLEEDTAKGLPQQEIKSFTELTYIFNDTFIGVEIFGRFENLIAPLLQRSGTRSALSRAETLHQG